MKIDDKLLIIFEFTFLLIFHNIRILVFLASYKFVLVFNVEFSSDNEGESIQLTESGDIPADDFLIDEDFEEDKKVSMCVCVMYNFGFG
jgi:hypothetical protein